MHWGKLRRTNPWKDKDVKTENIQYVVHVSVSILSTTLMFYCFTSKQLQFYPLRKIMQLIYKRFTLQQFSLLFQGEE